MAEMQRCPRRTFSRTSALTFRQAQVEDDMQDEGGEATDREGKVGGAGYPTSLR